MSKYKVGDKVLIKGWISRVDNTKGVTFPYRIDTLDDFMWCNENYIIDVSKTYEDGLNDAWELARKLYCEKNTYDLIEIFGIEYKNYSGSIIYSKVLKNLTPQEAFAKIEAYEESKSIKVGDVVYAQGIKGVVIDDCTEDSDDTCYVFCENGNVEDWKFIDLKKTGRHIDISNLLEQIRGDD